MNSGFYVNIHTFIFQLSIQTFILNNKIQIFKLSIAELHDIDNIFRRFYLK